MAVTITVDVQGYLTKIKTLQQRYNSMYGWSTYGPYYSDNTSSSARGWYMYSQTTRTDSLPYLYIQQIETMWEVTTLYIPLSGAIYSGKITFTASGSGRLVICPVGQGYNSTAKVDDIMNYTTLCTFGAGSVTYTFKSSTEAWQACTCGLAVVPTTLNSTAYYLSNMRATFVWSNTAMLPEVKALSPLSEAVLREKPTTFSWSYSHVTGIPMTGYELHMVSGSTDTVIASGDTAATSCTVPAETLPVGAMRWYVVCSAEEEGYTMTGRSEDQYLIVRTNPETSDVETDNKPRLTVTWTAHDQQAAQVRIGDTVYPIVWTTDGSYTAPEILDDGIYPVSVRTQTSEGDWSDWSETVYADIKTASPSGSLTAEADATAASVTVTWTPDPNYSQSFVLYRGDTPIYAGSATEYIDLRLCGSAEYTVRQLTGDGDYIEAVTMMVTSMPTQDMMIIPASDGGEAGIMYIRHHPNIAPRAWDDGAEVDLRYYAGREYPVAVTEGHKTKSMTVSAIYRTSSEAAALTSLVGRSVIYKTRRGDMISGVVTGASRQSGLTDSVSIRISRVGDDERAYIS